MVNYRLDLGFNKVISNLCDFILYVFLLYLLYALCFLSLFALCSMSFCFICFIGQSHIHKVEWLNLIVSLYNKALALIIK